jgi:hypothetical protein
MKFLIACMKSLTNCEIPSSNPLQIACSGFLIAACAFKVVPKPACDSENCSESRLGMYTRKNLPIRAKQSLNRNLMRISDQLLEWVSVFERSKQKLDFSLKLSRLKIIQLVTQSLQIL